MSSKLSLTGVRRLTIALLAVDAAKEALNVLTNPTPADPLLSVIAKDMVAAMSELNGKLRVLAEVTDTVCLLQASRNGKTAGSTKILRRPYKRS